MSKIDKWANIQHLLSLENGPPDPAKYLADWTDTELREYVRISDVYKQTGEINEADMEILNEIFKMHPLPAGMETDFPVLT
jgi:hypothetical protein